MCVYVSNLLSLLVCLMVNFKNTFWELLQKLYNLRMCCSGSFWLGLLAIILASESGFCVVCVYLCILSHLWTHRKFKTCKPKLTVKISDIGVF